ncbi:MAG: hypothetical protein WAK40_06650, partial [Thermoplasmata archaeon]
FYADQLAQAMPGRLRRLDADRSLDRLVPALGRIVRGVEPLRDRSRTARRLLDCFLEFPTERPAPRASVGNR